MFSRVNGLPIKMEKNKIFVVIPTFNGLKFTKKCLASFKNQTYKNFEVIIVDSESTDGTVEFVKRNYPNFTIIQGASKWWWTKATHEGVEYALSKASSDDFVLTMNNDCFFYEDYLKEILNASLKNRRAIIGSLILDAENKNFVIDAGVKINWKHSLIYAVSDKISNDLKFYTDRKIIGEIDTLPGKGSLIPISVFKRIGNFNYIRLPHYIGDYEFFCRAKRNGFRLAVASDARIYNYKRRTGYFSKTGNEKNKKSNFYLLFARKSKNNIVDYTNFVLLCCPKKYLNENIKIILSRLISFAPFIYKFRLWLHDSPIRIRQMPPVVLARLIVHNIPIYVRQNSYISRIRKYFFGRKVNQKTISCKICGQKSYLEYRDVFDNRHGYPGLFSIYRCYKCGFMQTEPQLTFRQLSSVYTNYYPKRDADIKSIINASKNIPSKNVIYKSGLGTTCHYRTRKGQSVLDIGCGACLSLLEIKRIGGKAWGLDPDKNAQKVAKVLKLRFHLGTIHTCTFPKKHFDLVTASQVLEHERKPQKFLADCTKFLKPNGKIILSFPNTGAISRKLWGKNWLHWHIPYHINHFNKNSFNILANSAGLKVVSTKTVTPNLWTILQIRSWINSPKMGQRDPMWDGSSSEQKSTMRVKSIVASLVPYITNFFALNRLFDYLGLGESIVVELRPI